MNVTTLYRPVGQWELDLIAASGYQSFPPRLSWQPIFYPVLEVEYAIQIARDWNVKDSANGNVGYVTRFTLPTDYVAQFPIQQVGGRIHRELWVPAQQLDEFNQHIIGTIEIIHEFRLAATAER